MTEPRTEPHIPAAQLAELVEIDPFWSLAPFAWTWAIVAATIYAQLEYGALWTLPVAMIFIARSQHALAILMHEGAHARVARSRRVNDFIGSYFAGYPVLISLSSYRRTHLFHHKDPLAATDPDLVLTSGYPVSRASFVRRLLRDLFGISFFKVFSYLTTGVTFRARKSGAPPITGTARYPRLEIAKAIGVQLLLLGLAFALGHPLEYFTLWLLPLMTVLQVLLRLRGLADHAGLPEPTADHPLPQHLRTRTVLSNPLTRFFLGPLHVSHHLEHHLYVGLPWYRLPAAHRILAPAFEAEGAPVARGYLEVWRSLIKE